MLLLLPFLFMLVFMFLMLLLLVLRLTFMSRFDREQTAGSYKLCYLGCIGIERHEKAMLSHLLLAQVLL